jgi:hypothetical protein
MELMERTWGAKWCAAMVKAQAKFPRIGKDKEVTVTGGKGTYTYDYTPLDVLVDKTKETLEQNDLGVFQDTWVEDGLVYVRTTIFHASGEFREFAPLCYPMPAGRIHDLGSLLSYLRRYSYLSALRLAPSDASDDDGKRIQEGDEPQWKRNSKPRKDGLKPGIGHHSPFPDEDPKVSTLAALYASNLAVACKKQDTDAIHRLIADMATECDDEGKPWLDVLKTATWHRLQSDHRSYMKGILATAEEPTAA